VKLFKFKIAAHESMAKLLSEPFIIAGKDLDDARINAMRSLEQNVHLYAPYVVPGSGVQIPVRKDPAEGA